MRKGMKAILFAGAAVGLTLGATMVSFAGTWKTGEGGQTRTNGGMILTMALMRKTAGSGSTGTMTVLRNTSCRILCCFGILPFTFCAKIIPWI